MGAIGVYVARRADGEIMTDRFMSRGRAHWPAPRKDVRTYLDPLADRNLANAIEARPKSKPRSAFAPAGWRIRTDAPAAEPVAREVREHPPVNGCTLVGSHACILSTGEPIPMVVAPPTVDRPKVARAARVARVARTRKAVPVAAPAAPAAGRPSCHKCGRTFRRKGSGLSWHMANFRHAAA